MSSATKIFVILSSIIACVFLFNEIPTPPYNSIGTTVSNFNGTALSIQTASQDLQTGNAYSAALNLITIPIGIGGILINSFILAPISALNQILIGMHPIIPLLLLTPVLFILFLAAVSWLFGRSQV
jgi:hypothetical protein